MSPAGVDCPDCGQTVVHDATVDAGLRRLAFANHERFCSPNSRPCDICREVQHLHDNGETDPGVYLAHLPVLRTVDGLRRHLVDHGNPLAAQMLGLHHIRPVQEAGRTKGNPRMTLQAVPPQAADDSRPDAATLAGHDDPRIARAAGKVLEAEEKLTVAYRAFAAKAELRAKRDRLKKQLAEVEAQLKGAAPAAVDAKKVRAWATDNGYDVAPSGIIPKAVVQAYRDATSGGAA